MADPHVELLDDARQAEAVADRTRRRLITEAGDQDASFASSLRAVAESGGTVLLDTTIGRTVRGRIEALIGTHVRVVDPHAVSYVAVDQVTIVRGVVGAAPVRATPDDHRGAAPMLAVALAELVAQRSPVDVHLVGGAVIRGEIRRLGSDVLTVADRATGGEALVNLARVAVITVPGGAS